MEELIQGNHDLLAQNESLKSELEALQNADHGPSSDKGNKGVTSAKVQAANDILHAEMVIELNEQIDESKQECVRLQRSAKMANAGETILKKEIQGLKYDNKRMNMDLKDSKERFEKVKMDYQQQFGTLKNTTVAMKQ